MKLGVIGYLAKTGIGVMTNEMIKHLPVKSVLAPPHDGAEYLAPPKPIHIKKLGAWSPRQDELYEWAKLVDVAITVETDWGPNTFSWLHEFGVKVVKLPMFEWFDPKASSNNDVDLWICTTRQCYVGIPYPNKIYLPWAVDTDHLRRVPKRGPASVFVHNAGNIGLKGRKGTLETLRGFYLSKTDDIKLVINTQKPLPSECHEIIQEDSRIVLFHRNLPDYRQLYDLGDTLIYCSLMDGQSLVGEEGMASGMAVITTDAPPMNEHWTFDGYANHNKNLLVKVAHTVNAETLNPSSVLNYVDEKDLAEKIDFCANTDISNYRLENLKIVEEQMSWNVLASKYHQAIRSIL